MDFVTPDDHLPPALMPPGKSPSDKFPDLPSRPGGIPWPADIIDGHTALKSVHEATSRALNLDESDPIRLRHYDKQIKGVMLSTLQALAASEKPPLPEHYIKDAVNVVRMLASSTATALDSSLKR